MNIIQYIIFLVLIYLILTNPDISYSTKYKETCRNCANKIDSDFLYCPYCQEEIKKKCDSCGRLIYVDWRYCPFCEKGNYKYKDNIKIRNRFME